MQYTAADGGEVEEVVTEENATLELSGEPLPLGTLQILEAKYGALEENDKTIDVTALVREAALAENNDKVSFIVNNKSMKKDPAPGKPKQLKISYQEAANGPVREYLVNEGQTASLVVGGPNVSAAPISADKTSQVANAVQLNAAASGAAVAWKSANGQLQANGQPFALKGVNWSGLETECRQFNGLDQTTAAAYLDLLAGQGFNAIKIPLSATLGLDLDSPTRKATNDPDLANLSVGDALAKVVILAGQRGLQVVLEMGRIDETKPTPDLWYDGRHSVEDVQHAWSNILGRVAGCNNVMGVNLKGSPHGCACWGESNPSQDWNKAAEQLANHILDNHSGFKGLFFVEGVSEVANVDADNKTQFPAWYGGNLQGVAKHPIKLHGDGNERVVYAARVFGPSTHKQEYFGRGDFPQCMWQVWGEHFGYLKGSQGSAVVISEFGESNESHEGRLWSNCIVDYLTQTGITDGFYSSGSIAEDWKTPNAERCESLKRLQANPTRL